MRRAIIVIVVIVVAAAGWLIWQQLVPDRFIVSGTVEADQIRVGSRVGGRVAEVLVEEGNSVRAGAELYRLDPFDLLQALAEAEAVRANAQHEHERLQSGFRPEEIEQARAERNAQAARLEKLVAGPRPAEIEIARKNLTRTQADLEFARSEEARLTKLWEDQQAGQLEVDQSVRTYKVAAAAAAVAQHELDLLLEGTRKEEVAEARASLAATEQALAIMEQGPRKEDIAKAAAALAAAQARVAATEMRIAELSVKSPCDCLVDVIDLRPGDLVPHDAPSVALLDRSRMWMRAYVPEARLSQVHIGQKVPIQFDGMPDERFTGTITFIAGEAEFTPRNVQTPEERSKQVFRIKVTLDQVTDRVRIGMMADLLLDRAGE